MENEKKWTPKFLILAMAVLAASTFLAWLTASGGGSTKIQRYTVPAENGANMSYVAWIPKSATSERPAPAVVLFPGRSSNGHQLDNWCMEYARAGFVAATVDWNGNGETDLMSTQDQYVRAVMESVIAMPYVDSKNIAAFGNSAGNTAATLACELYPENVTTYINDVHPWLFADLPAGVNLMMIEAAHDQYVTHFVGGQEEVERAVTEAWGLSEPVVQGKTYINPDDGTMRQFVITNTIHQTSALDGAGIRASTSFLSEVFPDTGAKAPARSLFPLYQLFQLFGYAGIIMFVVAFGMALYENIPFFKAIGNAPTPNKGLRGAALAKNVIIALAIPLITFFPVSWAFHNAEFLNPIFQSRNLRGIIGWLVTNSVITLVMTGFKARKAKRAGSPMKAADFGFAGEGESLRWGKVARAFLLALATVLVTYSWVGLVENMSGLNYQIWNVLNISRIPANRVFHCIPFVCCTVVIMLGGNIGMNTSRRLADTGHPNKDMAKQIVLNVCVSAGVITALLLLQYGIGQLTSVYIMPQLENLGSGGTSSGSLDFSFGFPLIMGFSAGMSTYFFRKTGNIWIGMFMSALLGGIVGVVGSTFITVHAVI